MKAKNLLRPVIAALIFLVMNTASATTPGDNNVRVAVRTSAGDFVIELFNDTPRHRDNFVKLVGEGFYNGLLFHRVIKDFMVQTGDPDSRNAAPGKMLGAGNSGYEIDAEILCPTHINSRGALAAARTGDNVNPERRSSGSQFYIVTGRKFSDGQLDQMEQRANMEKKQEIFNRLSRENRDSIMSLRRAGDSAGLEALRQDLIARTEAQAKAEPFSYSPEQREAYKTRGGAPHLDGAYTVFGEVVEGMDVIDRIEGVATDGNDRPLEDVKIISMEVLK